MDFSNLFASPGGLSASSGQSSGSTYFPQQNLIPGYAQQFVPNTFNQATGAQGQYQNYISNPTASPLYQNSLSGLLAALGPSEKMAGQNLADTFRAAGNMASGAYGTAASNLQGNILRNRQSLASNLLAQQFPEMTQALMAPQNLASQLMGTLKLSQQFGTPTGGGGGSSGGFGMRSGGGGGGFGGGSDPTSADSIFSDILAGRYNPAPYDPGMFLTGGSQQPSSSSGFYDSISQSLDNPYFSSTGGTLFMPGGNYVSGSSDPSQLYDPSQYAYAQGGGDTFAPWEGSLLTPPADTSSDSWY